MYNPSTTKADCAEHAGLVNQGGLNKPGLYNKESYNTFDRGRVRFTTQRFDQILPVYKSAEIEGNVSRLRSVHDLRTYTLNAPLMSSVKMHRSFFQVPWSIIMPKTWELIYRIPVKGDDINYPAVAPIVKVSSVVNYCYGLFAGLDASTASYAVDAIHAVLQVSSILSRSSLLKTLGCSLPYEEVGDQAFEALVDFISKWTDESSVISITDESLRGYFLKGTGLSVSEIFNFLEKAADYPNNMTCTIGAGDEAAYKTFVQSLQGLFAASELGVPATYFSDSTRTLDLMPVLAYQCIVAQYYSNSHVDDVYSAKMWNEALLSEFYATMSNSSVKPTTPFAYSFELNGVTYQYDLCSGNHLESIFSVRPNGTTDYLAYEALSRFILPLFTIGRSLKYGDYFTNARTTPLAVGDVDIEVSADSKVSAIDVNKKLWVQRLANAINRMNQNIYDYMEGLTGVSAERRVPQPNFICSESYNLGGMEVENTTSEDQGNVVTLLRNSESRYMYEVYIDEPSYVIGVNTFSVAQIYGKSTDRDFYHNERLDWFNPFAQHFGDQDVQAAEITIPKAGYDYESCTFGYQYRYGEFKNAISQATGGFIDGSLPSWALLYDDSEGYLNVCSGFIRNSNTAFDKLYKSLTGKNPSNRFHFILGIRFDNPVNSKQQATPTLI